MEITTTIILAIIFGASAFFGTITGGAGFIWIPSLIIAGLNPIVALGTSRIGLLGLTAGGSIIYGKHKKIQYSFAIPYLIFLSVGVILGAMTIISLSESLVQKLVGIAIILMTILFFFNYKVSKKEVKNINKKTFSLFSIASGYYSGSIGAGNGIFNRFMLTSFFSFSMIESAALSAFGNIINAIISLSIFTYYDLVEYSLFMPLFFGSLIGSMLGAKYAIKIGNDNIKKIFMAISILLAIYLLIT